MEGEGKFGQEPGFRSGQQFDAGAQRPKSVPEFKMIPNCRLVFEGESRRNSEPVRGTGGQRRISNQQQRRR